MPVQGCSGQARAAGRVRARLLDFGHVPVAADAVAVDALCDLRVQQVLLRAAARAAHAGLGVDDDVLCGDGARLRGGADWGTLGSAWVPAG